MPSQNTYCRGVWNLIQACDVQSSDYKVYISTPPSPEVENFHEILLPRQGSNPGPPEPEVDMLPSEPARRACSLKLKLFKSLLYVFEEVTQAKPLNCCTNHRLQRVELDICTGTFYAFSKLNLCA